MTAIVQSIAHSMVASEGALLPARNQMALSLGAHIILACFGMSLPAMIFVQHRLGLRGDPHALELAKRWSKVAGVLFALGAISGTILSFELGLLWPGLMERYGDVVGLAFAFEGISFFIEAIFLGIYVYGWGRLPGRAHSLMLIPMIISGIAGSFFVVSVNAWMNAPTGFTIIGDPVTGAVVDIDPWRAMFNDAVALQFLHMFLAAYMVVGFSVAGVYAAGMLRGRNDRHHRLGLIVPLLFAAVATPLQPMVGHFAGQRIADDQPIKLAAMEGIATTEEGAPLVLGGVYRDGELQWGLELPLGGLTSFLAQNDFGAEVIGLDSVPEQDQPPVNIVRFAFQIMVGLGTALVGLIGWAGWRFARRPGQFFDATWFLRALVVAGPAAVVAMETGWITTEVGRQPWIVHGLLRTEDAVTDASYIWVTLTALVIVYVGMGAAAFQVLRSMSRRWAAGEHNLASPYGPAALDDVPLPGDREGLVP
ncbi:MAG: cytochrome ubiquinol oxidase subunit I [Acidimicrobiales bacterium]